MQYRLFNDGAIDKTPVLRSVNLMLSYGFRDTRADLTLRVTNLFDDDGINSRFSDPYGSAQVMETFIPRRVRSAYWSGTSSAENAPSARNRTGTHQKRTDAVPVANQLFLRGPSSARDGPVRVLAAIAVTTSRSRHATQPSSS